MGWGMEQIDYNGLLNIEVIDHMYETQNSRTRKLSIPLFALVAVNYISDGLVTVFIIGVLIYIFRCAYLTSKLQKEKKELKKLVDFYNDCISNNECTELDDDSKCRFMDMGKDEMVNDLELIWEPEFIYDHETKVYKVEKTQVIIVNGYFEDVSISRKPKRNYIMVFMDGKYYMSCIDNLICWKKSDYYSKFYTEKSMINNEIKYKKW